MTESNQSNAPTWVPFAYGFRPFFLLAGLYFGGVYVWRGFGIVVAVHAIYDLVALLAGSGAQ